MRNKEKRRKYFKEYWKKNKEKLKKYRKEYYKNNVEKRRKYQKEYYKNNIENFSIERKEHNQKYIQHKMDSILNIDIDILPIFFTKNFYSFKKPFNEDFFSINAELLTQY